VRHRRLLALALCGLRCLIQSDAPIAPAGLRWANLGKLPSRQAPGASSSPRARLCLFTSTLTRFWEPLSTNLSPLPRGPPSAFPPQSFFSGLRNLLLVVVIVVVPEAAILFHPPQHPHSFSYCVSPTTHYNPYRRRNLLLRPRYDLPAVNI
jgi:hypothetical protein